MNWIVTYDKTFCIDIEELHEKPEDLFTVISGGMIDAGYFIL